MPGRCGQAFTPRVRQRRTRGKAPADRRRAVPAAGRGVPSSQRPGRHCSGALRPQARRGNRPAGPHAGADGLPPAHPQGSRV